MAFSCCLKTDSKFFVKIIKSTNREDGSAAHEKYSGAAERIADRTKINPRVLFRGFSSCMSFS